MGAEPPRERHRWTIQAVLVVIVAIALVLALFRKYMDDEIRSNYAQSARVAVHALQSVEAAHQREAQARQQAAQVTQQAVGLIPEIDRLRRENEALRREVRELRDQLRKAPADPPPAPPAGA
jgi:hypothetical protein